MKTKYPENKQKKPTKTRIANPKGVSQKPQFFVIARRNDEAIRLLSGISGLLHFVTNDDRRIISPVRDGMSVEK
jgi:hypothetical protein